MPRRLAGPAATLALFLLSVPLGAWSLFPDPDTTRVLRLSPAFSHVHYAKLQLAQADAEWFLKRSKGVPDAAFVRTINAEVKLGVEKFAEAYVSPRLAPDARTLRLQLLVSDFGRAHAAGGGPAFGCTYLVRFWDGSGEVARLERVVSLDGVQTRGGCGDAVRGSLVGAIRDFLLEH